MKKMTVNKAEYRALNHLRGTPQSVHMMIMCSRPTPTGGVLEGGEQAFEELVSFVGEEIAEGDLSVTSLRSLRSLCVKIDPGCAGWLGM